MSAPRGGRVGVWNRAVVTDRAEFIRRYQQRFETVAEIEPGTELYLAAVATGDQAGAEEDNVVYFFEIFADAEARRFHLENPAGMAAKALWWNDLLVSRSPLLLDPIWAKGMGTAEPAWLNGYGPDNPPPASVI